MGDGRHQGGDEKVGWIGLGQIGAPMAARLVDHPGGLVVCDVVPQATERLAGKGATVATDAAAVVRAGATIISVMVRDDAQVRDVVRMILTVAAPGAVIAVHSTIDPGTAEALAAEADASGVHLVDAPVSGGTMGAHSGRLAVLAGGTREAVDRCRGPFSAFADLVVHFGPAGTGTRAKIARNLVTFASFAAAGEASRLAAAAGLDLTALGEVVRHSDAVTMGAGAIMLRAEAAPMGADDGLRPIFSHTLALGEKDLDLALTLAAELGLDLPLASQARALLPAALGLHPHGAAEGVT